MKTGVTLAIAAIGAIGSTGLFSNIQIPFVSVGYAPPAQCVAWYDGCNMCQKVDGIVSCSNRLCSNRGAGFCREYATSTPQT